MAVELGLAKVKGRARWSSTARTRSAWHDAAGVRPSAPSLRTLTRPSRSPPLQTLPNAPNFPPTKQMFALRSSAALVRPAFAPACSFACGSRAFAARPLLTSAAAAFARPAPTATPLALGGRLSQLRRFSAQAGDKTGPATVGEGAFERLTWEGYLTKRKCVASRASLAAAGRTADASADHTSRPRRRRRSRSPQVSQAGRDPRRDPDDVHRPVPRHQLLCLAAVSAPPAISTSSPSHWPASGS